MKQKLTLILAITLLATTAFSQKKGTLLGLHFNLADFTAPLGIKDPITGKVYSKFRDMSKGISISYWKGITKRVDFSVKINAMFHDYAALYRNEARQTEIGLELEPTINIRPFNDAALFNPFLTVGVGGGYYSGEFAAYIPAGLGLQVNFNSQMYMFIQGQYKWSLEEKNLGDNLFYSIGLAQNIGREKVIAPPPPPPPPVVEVPADRDGDGVLDVDDKCPDVKGLASLQGCPDRDGDGIADGDDKCPDVAGLARYQGCPIPDTDGDGVNDEEDKCINEKGPASNFGCPVIDVVIVDKVNRAAKNIFFATGSAKLLAKSYTSLNSVVAILKDNPTYKVAIDGHTDDVGKDEMNQTLSDNRAASVKAYIVSKGIEEGRLTSTGYGESKPIADNKTAAGKAKNRRVEMTLSNY